MVVRLTFGHHAARRPCSLMAKVDLWSSRSFNEAARSLNEFHQERIEPAKPARQHATTIDGEIQIWRPDANFSNHQIWTRCTMCLDSLGKRLAHLSYVFTSEY